MEIYYKIFRRRQNQKYLVDITLQYSLNDEIYKFEGDNSAMEYAKKYKSKHKSDTVIIKKFSIEDIEVK